MKAKKNSPVNKGHSFDLETKDRIDAFLRERFLKVGRKNIKNIEIFGKNFRKIEQSEIIHY